MIKYRNAPPRRFIFMALAAFSILGILVFSSEDEQRANIRNNYRILVKNLTRTLVKAGPRVPLEAAPIPRGPAERPEVLQAHESKLLVSPTSADDSNRMAANASKPSPNLASGPLDQNPGASNPVASVCLKRNPHLWSRKISSLKRYSSMCSGLLAAAESGKEDQNEVMLSDAAMWTPPESHTDSSILELLKDCKRFFERVRFPSRPGSKEEADFPLAYVFVAHRNAAQTVRLFRMLYQPQNAYCIAYDTKSDEDYKQAVLALASCFPSNVYLTPSPEPIYYFGYSILRSVMTCLTVLMNSSIPWRYVQVVSWNDFPLRTNLEMVKIFKILNGSQDSELTKMDTPDYITFQWGEHGGVRRPVPPAGLTYYKGSFANSMSRDFINFTFTHPISVRFYESLEDSKCAEEFYWPTLIHNVQLEAPGGFPGQCELYYSNFGEKKPFLSRFQVWEWDAGDRVCKGKWINLSCVYGIRDLGMLLRRLELVAHKVYEESEPALLFCLEEWYWKRSCVGNGQLNWTFYENLPSVRYHRLSYKEKEKFVCTL